jgi:hypothetical protein
VVVDFEVETSLLVRWQMPETTERCSPSDGLTLAKRVSRLSTIELERTWRSMSS